MAMSPVTHEDGSCQRTATRESCYHLLCAMAAHCNALQHMQHTATHATRCNTLQHTATRESGYHPLDVTSYYEVDDHHFLELPCAAV